MPDNKSSWVRDVLGLDTIDPGLSVHDAWARAFAAAQVTLRAAIAMEKAVVRAWEEAEKDTDTDKTLAKAMKATMLSQHLASSAAGTALEVQQAMEVTTTYLKDSAP